MITDRIGRHEVLLPIIHNRNKINVLGFLKFKQKKYRELFFPAVKKGHLSAHERCTVLLHSSPISADLGLLL